MITEDGMKINGFFYIDHCAEGLGRRTHKENEVFIGRKMDCGDHDELFIEIKRDGKTVQTVNVKNISDIEFAI